MKQYKIYGQTPQNKSFVTIGRKTKADEYDDDETEAVFSRNGIYGRKLSINCFDYYLDTTITAPSNYRDVIQILNNLGKDDEMQIHLDTGGGRLDSAMRLIAAIKESEGNVVVIGAGLAASAGAIIFLQCPSVVVTPNTQMMIHAASYGAVGKEDEVGASVAFSQKYLDKMTQESYHGFLTPQEIELLKIGKDFYFDSEEIIERLEIRDKVQSKILEEREDLLAKKEAEAGKEEAMAKKKVKSKTKPVPKSK